MPRMYLSLNYLPAAVVCHGYRNQTQYVPESVHDIKNPHIRPSYLPVLSVLIPYASDAVAAADRRAVVTAITKKSLAIEYATFNFGRYSFVDKSAPCFFSKDFPRRELKTSTGIDMALLERFHIILRYGTVVSNNYYRILFTFTPTNTYPDAKKIIEMITAAAKSIIDTTGEPTATNDYLASVGIPRVCDELIDLIRSAHVQQQCVHYTRISWGKYRARACPLSVDATQLNVIHRQLEQFGSTGLWLS